MFLAQARQIYAKHSGTLANFIWRALQILGKQGVTFVIFLFCAQLLSPYDFGAYNYIFAIIFMFAIFSDFGVSVTASRYAAQYKVASPGKLEILQFNSIIIVLFFSSLVCIAVVLFRGKILYFEYLVYCLPLLFAIPLTSLYDGIFRGLKRFKELSLINLLYGILFIPLIYYSVSRWGLVGAIWAHNAYYCFLCIIIVAFSFVIKVPARMQYDRPLIADIIKYSVLVGMSDVGLFLYTRADVVILGHFNLVEEIGYYEIAYKIFIILLMPAQLLATVVAPKIAQLFVVKETETEIKKKYIRDTKLLFSCGLVLTVFFYAFMGPLFAVLFKNYDQSILMAVMLAFIILVPFRYFSTYISIGYITPSGNVAISTLTIILFGVMNVILDILLIRSIGFMGVVYATLISQFLFILTRDLLFYFMVIRKLDG